MFGYIRCACCNQPIAVSDDDIGLTLNCPRSGKMVLVKTSDIQTAGPTSKVPAVAKVPTRSPPPTPASKSSLPSGKSPAARTFPAPKPVVKEPRLPTPARSSGINRGLLFVACVSSLLLLSVTGFYITKSLQSDRGNSETAVRPESSPHTDLTPVRGCAKIICPFGDFDFISGVGFHSSTLRGIGAF
jgi:hypothetical protein